MNILNIITLRFLHKIILNSVVGDEYFLQFIHSQALPKNPSRTIQVRDTIFRTTLRAKTYKN
jgi:hypothetical protein